MDLYPFFWVINTIRLVNEASLKSFFKGGTLGHRDISYLTLIPLMEWCGPCTLDLLSRLSISNPAAKLSG
ncbi:MAG: hypothetical protein ACJAR1_001011 [Rubritalea sp.]|jgi:hypothetical protein